MDVKQPSGFLMAFSDLPDPRTTRGKRHPLPSILTLSVLAFMAGADCWTEVELFAKENQAWLEVLIDLPHGIPSHDTFGRVFAALSPVAFEQAFIQWTQNLSLASPQRVIAIDGKTARRSHGTSKEYPAMHMVSAWCEDNQLVLGQLKVDDKSNEITAMPKLIEMLNINNAIVTMDAMGCQRQIAETIAENKGDYIMVVKDNQKGLRELIEPLFDESLGRVNAELQHLGQ